MCLAVCQSWQIAEVGCVSQTMHYAYTPHLALYSCIQNVTLLLRVLLSVFCILWLTEIERGVQCIPAVRWISVGPYLTPGCCSFLISDVSIGETPGRVEHVHYLNGSGRMGESRELSSISCF